MSDRAIALFTRVALSAAFLSAVAGRLGIWEGIPFDRGHFDRFVAYTAEVNSFLPASFARPLAIAATVAELCLGVLLVTGLQLRRVAIAAAVLLATFATAMAISQGLKSPLDYSVYSACAAALLLARTGTRSMVRPPQRSPVGVQSAQGCASAPKI